MSSAGPLEGVRVLELGSFIAGPFAGQLMADFGAEVIKIESPDEGDPMRHWGVLHRGRSIWWSALARSKRLVAIDLRTEEGQETARRLAQTCDVVLENFTPGRLKDWHLGYDDLKVSNPKLVYTSVSGFGQSGPRSAEPGFGAIAEAMGGLRELMGWPDQPPARAAVSLGDHIAGLFAAFGTLAALRQADRDGEGQIVDVALYESVFAFTESLVADYELTGTIRTRTGGGLPGVAPSNAYPTADGRMVMIAANSDPIWTRLCVVMGRTELSNDDRYATHTARGQRVSEVDDIVRSWTRTVTFEELDTRLSGAAVPHSLIYRAPDILSDEQYAERGMIERRYDDEMGCAVPMVGVVPRLTRTPGSIRWTGQKIGAHTSEVLQELGVLE
jgi:formyl-CoA transferase/succinyl-CoA--D-citramalate CoA-transferase